MNTITNYRNTLLGMAAALILGFTGCTSFSPGKIVEEPLGRFSFKVSPELTVHSTNGTYYHYTNSDPVVQGYITAIEAENEQEGILRAFDHVGLDLREFDLSGTTAFGEWQLQRYDHPDFTDWMAIAYQYRGDTVYAFIANGGPDSSPVKLPGNLFGILRSFTFSDTAGEIFRPADLTELKEYVKGRALENNSSISMAVLKDGESVLQYTAGKIAPDVSGTTEAVYHWGSITKLVTATAVMQQVEDGKIDLDAAINTYFPEFAPGKEIKVRHLLSHSSGLPGAEVLHLVTIGNMKSSMPDMEDFLADYWSGISKLDFVPGSSSVYNNYNYLVLGVLIERVSGEALTDYIKSNIFTPLGMQQTFYTSQELPQETKEALAIISKKELIPLLSILKESGYDRESVIAFETESHVYLNPFNIYPCWGGIKSTPADALRFAEMFLNYGKAGDIRLLEKSSVRKMMSMQKSNSGKPLDMGLGWFLGCQGKYSYAGHAGGGPGIDSLLRIYPKHDLAIVVFGNMAGYGSESIVEYTANLYLEH